MRQRIILRIHYGQRSGVVALLTTTVLVAAFLGYLGWKPVRAAESHAQAPMSTAPIMRQYYLTIDGFYGAQASTACASGYHMAAMWEILDTSKLKYNTALGYTTDDSGSGPPTPFSNAWVRTGNASQAAMANQGAPNCNAWSSSSSSLWGTFIMLSEEWDTPPTVTVWDAAIGLCSNMLRVWCVADNVGVEIYLPLIYRH